MPAAAKSPSAADRAYAHVKERLLAGAYGDGELLSEGAIADELGISRTPVREALLQLQAERLLTLYPKRGALVTPLSAREVAELFETRRLIELHCLRAAPAATIVPALEALLERQHELATATHAAAPPAGARAAAPPVPHVGTRAAARPAPPGGTATADLAAFVTADREFHRTWVAAAGNAILLDLYDRLRDRQQRVMLATIVADESRVAKLLEEHQRILDALRSGDRDAAATALDAHLDVARRRTV